MLPDSKRAPEDHPVVLRAMVAMESPKGEEAIVAADEVENYVLLGFKCKTDAAKKAHTACAETRKAAEVEAEKRKGSRLILPPNI